jgi:type I restriction enzyme M protein
MTITLQDLERSLWNAANALRGPVDPADFKTYVFPMLFWKWISDTWEYERDQAAAEYGDELDDEIESDFHQFDLPDGTRWFQVTNASVNLGAKITKAFGRIEQANPKQLNGIFGDAVWSNEDRLP